MKLMPSSPEECRSGGQFADFGMECDTKHTREFFPSPACDKSSIVENGYKETSLENCVVENKKSVPECNSPESINKVTQNGDFASANESSFRESPAPSTISESESELKLVYSSENEDEVKNTTSMVNGNSESKSQDNKDEEEAMEVEESTPPSEEKTKSETPVEAREPPPSTDDKMKEDSTPVDVSSGENDTSSEDSEPKILEAHTDVNADFSEEVKPGEEEVTKSEEEKSETELPPDQSEEEMKVGDEVTSQEEPSVTTAEKTSSEVNDKVEEKSPKVEDSEPKKTSESSTICESLLEAPSETKSDTNCEDSKPSAQNEDENPFFEESVDLSDSSETENDSVANIIKNLEKEDGNDSDSSLEREIANEDISNLDNDNADQLLDVGPSSELKDKDEKCKEEKVEEGKEAKSTKIEEDLSKKDEVEEKDEVDSKDSKMDSDDVKMDADDSKMDSDEAIVDSKDSKTGSIVDSKHSNIDSDDAKVNSEDSKMDSDDVKLDSKDAKMDSEDMKDVSKPESMEVEESKNQVSKKENVPSSDNSKRSLDPSSSSSKRSLDPDEAETKVESEAKKMKIDEVVKPADKKADVVEEKVESDQKSSARLKVKTSSKDKELHETTQTKGKPLVKNFFNLALTEDELRAMGNITRLSKKDLEKLVMAKTLETVALRSKLATKNQEVAVMQDKVAEYKKKLQPLNKQVSDLSNVVLRLEQSLKKNPKPARPLKVTRSVGLQVSFNGPMPPKMGVNAPIVRQGVKTLRPVTRPGGSTPLQPARQATPSPASKMMRAAVSGPNARNMSTSTTPAKSAPCPISPRGQAPLARLPPGMPTISPVPMSSLQSAHTSNTAVVMPRQNNTMDDTAQVRAGQMIPAQQFMVQNGKRFILPPQVSEAMAKQGSNPPVAFIVQSNAQSQPMLITPNGQPAGQSLSSLNLNAVQWVKNMATAGGVQQNMGQRPLTSAAGIRPNQIAIRPTAQGVPLQRGSLYTVGPTVASIPRHQNFMANRMQHPAPLPSVPPHPAPRPGWKLAPPKPILKISKVQNGIVLSWNMSMTSDHEDMKSYQIYAYQETKDPPSSSLWKTVGDVKALALPMACTLTQFKEGHKYHFSVRAVDIHSRMGPHSDPTSIVLK